MEERGSRTARRDDVGETVAGSDVGGAVAGGDLGAALAAARAVVGEAQFPFDVPGAAAARGRATELAAQLDDYLVPRLRRIDAPLLAVVGGSTGAGKSTLVNSLIRAPVSPAGVLRPTTRTPLLVCHPCDGSWFGEPSLLGRLVRSTHPGEHRLQIVNAPFLRPGLALLDSADIDSVVAANRVLAHELLAAADLWLFVTTAARYADAVPWEVLRGAKDRGTAVAAVLDRVPPAVRDDVARDYARMLVEQGLGDAPLFVVRESTLDGQGLVPEPEVASIKRWLDAVAAAERSRRRIARGTLLGAVAAAGPRIEALALAADDQTRAVCTLAAAVRDAYASAMTEVQDRVRAGSLLRGEVYAGWQQLVADGTVRAALQAGGTGPPVLPAGRAFLPMLISAIATMLAEVDLAAADRIRARWGANPAGRELLSADETLARPWRGFADAAHDLVHRWQTWLRSVMTGEESPHERTPARTLLAMIAALAPMQDEHRTNSAAQSSAAQSSAAQSSMLAAVAADPAVQTWGEQAREELLVRTGDLLSLEVERHLAAISAAGVSADLGARLRQCAARLGVARAQLPREEAA